MENPTNPDSEVFKKPSFLPPEKIPPKPASTTVENTADNEEKPPKPSLSSETSNESKASVARTSTAPIPYQEPSWGGLPDVLYSLEEMKSGVSLKTIPLDQRSFYCFGRLDNCHVVMAHPTISRFHAVLQFRSTFSADDERKGFYLYDLGSTHGTFLNKERITPKTYVKIQVGHMIKFGSSTRFFLLHGPEEDQEEESKYSYTQLRELRDKEVERRQQVYLEERAKLFEEAKEREEEEEARGIDWGMGEDADEETDLTENPFALTTNEELYIDDPKKVLRNWFEREGEELSYKVDEKGFGQFRCSVELPIENAGGGYVIAEATVSGKKKDAVFQCALEACRILDRSGMLKQSNQESRKKKLKNWEEDDYYESDEDSFFDRTGDLETKRKQRMNQVQKTQPTVDTYETLVVKHNNVLKEIEETERRLESMLACASGNSSSAADSLDTYMANISKGQVDKLEVRKCRTLLSNLRTDEERLRKLVNFVKPFELPEIKPPSVTKLPEPEVQVSSPPPASEEPTIKAKPSKSLIQEASPPEVTSTEEKTSASKKEDLKSEDSSEFAPPIAAKRPKKDPSVNSKNIAKAYSNQYEEDFNNIVWAPPTGQTGDGRTRLNDKYGY